MVYITKVIKFTKKDLVPDIVLFVNNPKEFLTKRYHFKNIDCFDCLYTNVSNSISNSNRKELSELSLKDNIYEAMIINLFFVSENYKSGGVIEYYEETLFPEFSIDNLEDNQNFTDTETKDLKNAYYSIIRSLEKRLAILKGKKEMKIQQFVNKGKPINLGKVTDLVLFMTKPMNFMYTR